MTGIFYNYPDKRNGKIFLIILRNNITMKRRIFIILAITTIVTGSFVYYLIHQHRKELKEKKDKKEEQESKMDQFKSTLVANQLIHIYDLTNGIPKDSQEYYKKRALDISLALAPNDTILAQLSALEIRVNSLIINKKEKKDTNHTHSNAKNK
jgi:hypothetical protein